MVDCDATVPAHSEGETSDLLGGGGEREGGKEGERGRGEGEGGEGGREGEGGGGGEEREEGEIMNESETKGEHAYM